MLTKEENDRFESTDWTREINDVRRQVKVGSFALDGDGDLRSIYTDEQLIPHLVADRLHGVRGFAHPRMWAQYADNSRGVCVVFDSTRSSKRSSHSVAPVAWHMHSET